MEGRSAENGRVEEGEGKGRGGKGGREGGRERGREGGRGDLPYQSYFVSGAGEHRADIIISRDSEYFIMVGLLVQLRIKTL